MATLSAYVPGKIIVACECGLNRRYDSHKMLDRAGDIGMPDLLARIARAEGCDRMNIKSSVYGRCRLVFKLDQMTSR